MSLDATTTNHRAAALTSASALAMYDAAETTPDKLRAAAAMAEVLRRPKATKAPATTTGPLTAERLRAAMKPALAVIERGNAIPTLACMVMFSKGGRLSLTATDLDSVYTTTIPAEGLAEFCMAVPAHSLAATLAHCKGAVAFRDDTDHPKAGATHKVGRHVTDDTGEKVWKEIDEPIPPTYLLTMTCGDADTRIPCLDPLSVPIMSEPSGNPQTAMMPAEAMVGPMNFVLPGVSTGETRYYLNGVYMEVAHEDGGTRLNFVATDGSRLFRDQGAEAFGLQPLGAIIPLKVAKWIVANARGEIAVEAWEGRIRITTNDSSIMFKLIDGNFPDYRRVIPAEAAACKVAIEDPAAFKATLNRVLAISQEKSRSVRLEMAENMVKATVRNMGRGVAEAFLPAFCSYGPGMEISVNGKFLREMVTAPGEMHITSSNNPIRYDFDAHPGRTAALMPLRV